MIFINSRLSIPNSELQWEYVRSSGPGGQNVNRTNSCAVLRWNYLTSQSLRAHAASEEVLEKLRAEATKDGDIIIRSQTFRDQERNYQECIDKFTELLRKVFFKPKPRLATKPTKSSKKKRLQNKKFHSEKKASRQKRFE
jgi:ribosome-associated protein